MKGQLLSVPPFVQLIFFYMTLLTLYGLISFKYVFTVKASAADQLLIHFS